MKIALTFDIERDIPNVLDTDFGVKIGLNKILNILDDFHIKATFFCTGRVVQEQQWIINLIESKEHEIACHSLNHERLKNLTFKECKEIISNNKKIIEDKCQKSEIIGFRAPYLKPPKFVFNLLNDLGFKYDSSISSRNKSEFPQRNTYKIQEFHPIKVYPFFRVPFLFYSIKSWIFKKELIVLYFHCWEAIDMKELMFNQRSKLSLFKDYFIRLDRWINTGNSFLSRIRKFIKEALSKKAEFITLNQMAIVYQ